MATGSVQLPDNSQRCAEPVRHFVIHLSTQAPLSVFRFTTNQTECGAFFHS
jgi:hypothetical protein